MEIKIKAILLKGEDIEMFPIIVNDLKYVIVRKKLELEYDKINLLLKKWNQEGKILSIFKPKNKSMQKKIDKLVEAKREMKKSIKLIKEVFYK